MILTDNEVIQQVLLGNKKTFEILMRRNNQLLYRTIKGILKDDQEIQDVMQETYIKSYLNLSSYKGTSKFSTWLIRIGINEALAMLKQNKKFETYTNYTEILETEMDLKQDINKNPDRIVVQGELKEILENAISQLSPEYRVIFMLREIEGFSHQDIANSLEMTTNNVKVKIHRAKNFLKDELLKSASMTSLFEFGNAKCDLLVDKVMKRISMIKFNCNSSKSWQS